MQVLVVLRSRALILVSEVDLTTLYTTKEFGKSCQYAIQQQGLENQHNILQSHNNVMWDCQYFTEYSIIQSGMVNPSLAS